MANGIKKRFEFAKTQIIGIKSIKEETVLEPILNESTQVPQPEFLEDSVETIDELINEKKVVRNDNFHSILNSFNTVPKSQPIEPKPYISQSSTANDSTSSALSLKQNTNLDFVEEVEIYKPKLKTLAWYQNSNYYLALLISFCSLVFLTFLTYTDKLNSLGFSNINHLHVIIGSGLLMLVLDLILIFKISKGVSFVKNLHNFFAIFVVQLSAVLYSLKIYGADVFSVNGFMFNTSMIVFLFPVLTFFFLIDVIQKKNRMLVNIAVVFIILNQLFSTVRLFNENSFEKKEFGLDIVNKIFELPPFVWVLFATVSLAIITTFNLKQGFTRFIFVVGMMLPILNMITYTRVSTYWYQSILGLIVWDMFYTPMYESEKDTTDNRVMSKLMVSSIYHLILFVGLLALNTVVNFINVRP